LQICWGKICYSFPPTHFNFSLTFPYIFFKTAFFNIDTAKEEKVLAMDEKLFDKEKMFSSPDETILAAAKQCCPPPKTFCPWMKTFHTWMKLF
jgi:hypothetical protein